MKTIKTLLTSSIIFVLFILFAFVVTSAEAASLPDVLGEFGDFGEFGEWVGTPPRVTEFTVTKDNENLGRWENRTYTRAAPIAGVEANLMEGPGPGALFVPDGKVSASAAEGTSLEPSSSYETLTVAGKRAILESDELTGMALAAALDGGTLTLETKSLSREEFLEFARTLIAALEGK